MAMNVANEFEKKGGCWTDLKLNPDRFEMSECCFAPCQTQDNKPKSRRYGFLSLPMQ